MGPGYLGQAPNHYPPRGNRQAAIPLIGLFKTSSFLNAEHEIVQLSEL